LLGLNFDKINKHFAVQRIQRPLVNAIAVFRKFNTAVCIVNVT